mgnify:CR=1 FL=1
MANATVLKGPYGFYYPYSDETGNHGIKILDEVYEKYYKHGYLTDKHLEAMINGANITFNVPNKSGSGFTEVKAKIIPYTNKQGKTCKIIQFSSNKLDDNKLIIANAEKIACSYWSNGRFNYMKPQEELNKLDLDQSWRTWATNSYLNGKRYGEIKVYRPRARKNDDIFLYCEVNNDNCILITEEQFKSAQALDRTRREEEYEKARIEQEKIVKVMKDMNNWLDSVIDIIWPGGASVTNTQLIDNANQLVSNINVSNIDDRVLGLVSSKTFAGNISYYIQETRKDISRINSNNYQDTAFLENIKVKLLNNIKVFIKYLTITQVRKDLLAEYNQSGLASMTDSIDIDTALNLGYFHTVQKVLVKYKQDSPKYIINNMYLEVIDEKELKEKLLNLLKIYYDFYDMPEKDRKAIAKYIAKHKLSDYYDRISKFDDVLETLIDESRDPKLTKPILESIAGTSRANCLKDKTFYFEKRGRLRDNILLYKPIELVDMLRSHIKEFNASSDVAILTNIELDSDESFIFQFYTFAGNNSAEGEFDGRRMLNLTRIFNRHHPKEKIGFVFDNSSSNEE